MSNLQTEREYLASLTPPLARPGRGRFSNDAKAALAKARSEGMNFREATPAKTPAAPKAARGSVVKDDATSVPAEPVVEKPVKVDPKTYFGPTPERRPDRKADVYETASGIRRTYKDACSVCKMSIGWCGCAVAHTIDRDSNLLPLSPVLTRS